MDFPLVTIHNSQELDFIHNLFHGNFPFRVVTTSNNGDAIIHAGSAIIYIDEENIEEGERLLDSVGYRSDRQLEQEKSPHLKRKIEALDKKAFSFFLLALVALGLWLFLLELRKLP